MIWNPNTESSADELISGAGHVLGSSEGDKLGGGASDDAAL